ncbi:class I SAM-dependent methyltransferase [Sandarakinorhabdus sp. DWP1-3-1]|uniref:class I SAM-dependent methyltransferase n=1 Tax=Sandarakinorhabdus sp. DWP1-3-1 TaxID=2804627 RepID=UPI003CF2C42C
MNAIVPATPLAADHGTGAELATFSDLWAGGYCEGDPLNPVATSGYGDLGYISVLHAAHLVCIRPFIKPDTVALEIGPGRGTFTRSLLDAREIWCMDALDAEHNGFWQHVGEAARPRIHYHRVADFSCSVLPDGHFDFIFSFGVFCHITAEGQRAYYRNLFAKAKPGANAMIMFADFDKYNRAMSQIDRLRTLRFSLGGIKAALLFNARIIKARLKGQGRLRDKQDARLGPGKFHHMGIAETVDILHSIGWDVVSPDVGINLRDPIVHFRKPLDRP